MTQRRRHNGVGFIESYNGLAVTLFCPESGQQRVVHPSKVNTTIAQMVRKAKEMRPTDPFSLGSLGVLDQVTQGAHTNA